MERFYHGGTKNTEVEIWKNVTHDSYQEENKRRKFGNAYFFLTPANCQLPIANCLLLPHTFF